MIESITPDPTQDELTAILEALTRRTAGNRTRRDPDVEFGDAWAAAREETRRRR